MFHSLESNFTLDCEDSTETERNFRNNDNKRSAHVETMFQDIIAEPYEHWGDHLSSSLGTYQPMEEVSNEPSYSEAESSGTEQSFRTACATIPRIAKKVPRRVSRKSRFIEQFGSLKLTKANLHALEASQDRITPKPATPVEREIRFESSPHGKTFLSLASHFQKPHERYFKR
ncbi:hypothetical protein IG631_17299 [Alternaria alternata]|nr:hypothetical protein IG631_17299 [Alternaria alternata]